MDEFAQSRGDDDLFDDEIVPLETNQQTAQTDALAVPQSNPEIIPSATEAELSSPLEESIPHTRGRGRARARERGRGGSARGDTQRGLGSSRFASKAPNPQAQAPKQEDSTTALPKENSDIQPQSIESADAEGLANGDKIIEVPTGPANPTPSRPPAVKGDRLNTGGIQRPKLSEDELNAKLAAAKERNQNRAAAYAREQADAENFAQREKLALEHRAVESAQRKALEGEREKNRARKLKGQGGREWDAKKNETDYSGRGTNEMRKWAGTPGDEENDLSMYEWNDDRGRGRGRGRGGRGGRGRGRGDRRGTRDVYQVQPNVQAETEFPALPTSEAKPANTTQRSGQKAQDLFEQTGGGSWAEQMEAGDAAKN